MEKEPFRQPWRWKGVTEEKIVLLCGGYHSRSLSKLFGLFPQCPPAPSLVSFGRGAEDYDAQIRRRYRRDTPWICLGHGFYTQKTKYRIRYVAHFEVTRHHKLRSLVMI